MQLTNTVVVNAAPDAVFALVSDVEKVASCMPGAALDGRDGDAWRGAVKVKVGPISAAYAGTVRFLEVDTEKRRLRVHASGADTHGNGDAEAEVVLDIGEAPEGARLELSTDLLIRGKLAQFGKGAIATVSDRILQQFAQNLGNLLLDQGSAATGAAPASAAQPKAATTGTPTAPAELDGLSLVAGPLLAKYGPVAAGLAVGLVQGWLFGKLRAQSAQLKDLRLKDLRRQG
ncbi:SRPBCC family protein [Streptomyces sp. NBC_01016]|uniref:SRPBCC family protein n=1 Tax=Streptomyces sp. NBC_01016 TaxID=2903720 RepID=UPI00224DB5A0|nr:SRPBCC family protein [Streptomyces sp. NBC_01016]MCX4835448.1 SRPBCC family protein [Streptomyces sp. NBC_01016]